MFLVTNSQPHIIATLQAVKAKQKSWFGAMHLKEIIKTNHVQLKSRISRQWFTQNVLLKWEIPVISLNDDGCHVNQRD